MATIKLYTDLKQSKVLSRILPLKSADLFYVAGKGEPIFIGNKMVAYGDDDYDALGGPDVLCWSLAALLSVLPPYLYEWEKGIDFNLYPSVAKKRWWCAGYISQDLSPENKDKFTLITHADTPVDACYEMILKLHELNLL